jgi:hypothetical protein
MEPVSQAELATVSVSDENHYPASAELTTLHLGGDFAAVHARETSEQPQEGLATPEVSTMADTMFHDYLQGCPWPKETFFNKSGPDILQAVRLTCQKINFARTEDGVVPLNILELADVIEEQTRNLSSPLRILCTWTVLVRIGVRKLQRDLRGLIATVPMPSQGTVKLSQPADTVGKTHYVVTHLLGEKFLCRGYSMHITCDGDWILGGPEGNRWHKDLWLTPGIQSVDSILSAKQRKITPHGRGASGKEAAFVKRTLDDTRSRLERARRDAGIKAENFGAAHGARLDLENTAIMVAALACVRAMIAQVLSAKEDHILDDIAGRQGLTKAALTQAPALAGPEEAAFQHHVSRRTHANDAYRASGRFVIPQGYMVFAPQGVPSTIPEEVRTVIAGVHGVAVGAESLASFDYGQLRRSPAALSDVEDLTPLIDACGVSVVRGEVVNDMELVQEEGGEEYMRYYVTGREPQEMLVAEFLKGVTVKFLPMVIRCKRQRMFPEDMQGSQNGIYFAMSFEDVAERFIPCKTRYTNKSE